MSCGDPSIQMAKKFAYMPVVDMGPLAKDGACGREKVAAQLRAAIEEFGTCHVINHGVSMALVKGLQTACLRYFRLPKEEKRKHGADFLPQQSVKHGGVSLLREGFHAFDRGVPVNDLASGTEETPARTRESLMYYSCPPSIRNEELWPESLRKELSLFSTALHGLNTLLLMLLAESLGIPSTSFGDGIDNADVQLMAIHFYPGRTQKPREKQAISDEKKFGLAPHKDTTLLTTLLCSDVPGLQVVEDGEWIDVEPVEGSFIVQPGVLMQILSNEIFKAKLHRVINPSLPRCSIVSGVRLSVNATVEPLAPLVRRETPARFTRVKVGDYMHISRGAGLVTNGDHLDRFRLSHRVACN